jgi:hypothetical protein
MEVIGHHDPATLPSKGNSSRYPLKRRLGGLQGRSERYGEEEILLCKALKYYTETEGNPISHEPYSSGFSAST